MGYMHIDNLYKSKQILSFKTCYALEKIHGTSAHLMFKDGALQFHSGGEKYDRFVALFDVPTLTTKFTEKFGAGQTVTIYGEAYGGKQQGMSATYGKDLKFIAFEARINDLWLSVPQAADLVATLGLEFVDYVEISTDLESLNAERDRPSTQAKRNGIEGDKIREGIVLRPPFECTLNNGDRLIAKYKREEFSELASGRPKLADLDPTTANLRDLAEATADKWVTAMRLEHVIDAIIQNRDNKEIGMEDTPLVIKTMIEDILREGSGEVEDSKLLRKAIGSLTVKLFKTRVHTIG